MERITCFVVVCLALLSVASWAQEEPLLRIGSWLEAEEWHNWLGSSEETSPVQAFFSDSLQEIEYVDFFYSLDGGGYWEPLGTDMEPADPILDTYGTAEPGENGWYIDFPLDLVPFLEPAPLMIKAVAIDYTGLVFDEVEKTVMYDPHPPSACNLNVEDFDVIETDTLYLEIVPLGGLIIDSVVVHEEPKDSVFDKGVPGIDQHGHGPSSCAPTAAAQCLKYFESQGDTAVTQGLGDYPLVERLARYMHTDVPVPGTSMSDWVAGMTRWVNNHGHNYTVRYNSHYDQNGNRTWGSGDWDTMRNELERCQNVLSAVYWDGGGGHAMTFNSVRNDTLPNGKIQVDFKDPATGNTEWGDLDPGTGRIDPMGGGGGGGGATIGGTMIVCPSEDQPGSGGPGGRRWGGPNPYPGALKLVLDHPGMWFLHVTVINNATHAYRFIKIVDYAPSAYVGKDADDLPAVFYLNQNTPNPFVRGTDIGYAMVSAGKVRIAVYDVRGRSITTLIDEEVPAGFRNVTWDGTDAQGNRVAPGTYYIRMQTAKHDQTRTAVVLR
jgi:hypothetical protein